MLSRFGSDLLLALGERPHRISPKYFYDAEGSRLFDRICELPEYYPTRTEVAILERSVGEMAALAGRGAEIVEFGAGSLRKVRLLLQAFEAPALEPGEHGAQEAPGGDGEHAAGEQRLDDA